MIKNMNPKNDVSESLLPQLRPGDDLGIVFDVLDLVTVCRQNDRRMALDDGIIRLGISIAFSAEEQDG